MTLWLLISVLVGVIVVALGFFFLGAGMGRWWK